MKKLAIAVMTLGLAVAQAASAVTVNLVSPMTASGTELKAGEYKIQVEGNTVVFKSDRKSFTVPATTQKGGGKFSVTSMESEGSTLKSIHIGGTDTTITFTTTAAVAGGN
jgi:hypothetical protein